MWKFAQLPDRAFIAFSGPDAPVFLQGLVTQDVHKLEREPLLYSALLTPQGKYLYDFFLWHEDKRILLETSAQKRDELLVLLQKYKLRKNVALTPAEHDVYQIFGGTSPDQNIGIPDPRHPDLGYRSLHKPDMAEASLEEWTTHRLRHDVPDCAVDLRAGLSTPFEGNIDLLNGIDFNKGCYMGQELVSRIHHRGLVKRRFPDL